MLRTIRFSWTGLAIAPLIVPVAFAALLSTQSPGKSPVAGFLILLTIGCAFTYAATFFLLVPGLFVFSRMMTIKWHTACLIGFALGALSFLPIAWLSFQSSGPDSGPAVGTFLDYLWRCRGDVFNLIYPLTGMITAAAFWMLGTLRGKKSKKGH
jgi:hypothetical protein